MWSNLNKLMIGLTLIVCVVQIGYWFGRLSDPIPSHFDGTGQVDGHMNKLAFCSFMGLAHALFLMGFPIMGSLIKRLPDSVINIPNRDYWLAATRRDETISASAGVISAAGWMTSWLFISIFQLTARVAIKQRETINPEFICILGVYLVGVAAIVVFLMLRFRIPAVDPNIQIQ